MRDATIQCNIKRISMLLGDRDLRASRRHKIMLPARFELAAFGFLFLEQSYSTRYETDVITDYTKEAVGYFDGRVKFSISYKVND